MLNFILENAPAGIDSIGNFAGMAAGGAATGGVISYILSNRIIERLVKLETQMESLIASRGNTNETMTLLVEAEIRKMVKPESLK